MSGPLRGPAARHANARKPSDKQLAYLRSLLTDVGIVDPERDPAWPTSASRILGRTITAGGLDQFTAGDVSEIIDAAKSFLAADSARIERLPAAFIDPADDPWASAPTPPTVIRYQGHTYQRIDA